jgi:hypothetical protein
MSSPSCQNKDDATAGFDYARLVSGYTRQGKDTRDFAIGCWIAIGGW